MKVRKLIAATFAYAGIGFKGDVIERERTLFLFVENTNCEEGVIAAEHYANTGNCCERWLQQSAGTEGITSKSKHRRNLNLGEKEYLLHTKKLLRVIVTAWEIRKLALKLYQVVRRNR